VTGDDRDRLDVSGIAGCERAILTAWLLPMVLALIRLRRYQLDGVARLLWVSVVVLVPFVGVLAFLIAQPGRPRPGGNDGGQPDQHTGR
jgi:hypothetical protein